MSLLGPVSTINGQAITTWKEWTIASAERYGEKIPVEVPTHVSGLLGFASGAVATVMMSFDVKGGTRHPPIEIYSNEGTIIVSDSNTFGGPVLVKRNGESDFKEMPLLFPYADNSRGLGLSDLAQSILSDRPHRACEDLALHILEIMTGMLLASAEGKTQTTKYPAQRPDPLAVTN